jgi:hypothetical protein
MNIGDQRARGIQRQLGEVLLRHWDPVGVKAEPDAQDEYDAYLGPVYRLLASGASDRDIAEHIAQVKATRLGFPDTDPQMRIPLTNRPHHLNVRLGSGGGAMRIQP